MGILLDCNIDFCSNRFNLVKHRVENNQVLNMIRAMQVVKSFVVALFFLCGCVFAACAADINTKGAENIQVPHGFRVNVFSDAVPNARSLALGSDGTVFVGTRTEGKVYALPDRNRDGKADHVYVLASGLTLPNGVAYLDGDLYVAEVPRLIRFKNILSHLNKPPEPDVVYDWFPTKLHHGWKYLRVGPDGKLYMPIGAPCNICRSKRALFATIIRMTKDGEDLEIFARGIRNSVGFDWHPKTHEMFFTDNGVDWMGDELPPDELNRTSSANRHFGFPFCHAGRYLDPKFGNDDSCTNYSAPAWKFPAHVAPLGIRFYTGKQFPAEYRNQLFVAQHGSWNRTKLRGYRVVLVKFQDGKPVSSNVFAKGWLNSSGISWGQPVDILQLADGSLLVSDDKNGAIYRISYRSEDSGG